MQQHNDGHMKFLLTLASPLIVFAIFMIYWYLLQIEINKTINLPTGLESVGSHEDFAKKKSANKTQQQEGLEEESAAESEQQKAANTTIETEEEKPLRYRITKLRNITLLFTALAVSLLTYLILVVSNASLWLSLLGVASVIGLGLWQQIADELRRQRLDRIVAIVTLIFLSASFMSLATYASKSLKEGDIYQGKARIVGFDYNSYDNSKNDGITRTDLEVEWGSDWGCPNEGGKQCQAFVQGAMCESEQDESKDDGNRFRNRIRRYLEQDNNNQDAEEQEVEEEEQENEDLEEEVEEEEEEVDEEAAEEEDLEEDLEDEEEYNEELEEEVEELEEDIADGYTYYYDDDLMYDSYWDEQDWSSVWGEYACYDLFDYDMSGGEYDADEEPGEDGWPFITIYGNCRSCDAYIVDYFSTEHFNSLQSYRIQGRNYLIFSLFGLVLTALLHFKHRMDPIAEKELELLPNDGGALA